ncbi:MAG: hypothetical protein LBU07_04140 [Coriobacteriales bacterium]|nr:hypothetical protein [Coriobacteriales bacterium]
MLDYSDVFALEPFALGAQDKNRLYGAWLDRLGAHHRHFCAPYARLCATLGNRPALPVRLFKYVDLRSVASHDVARTMTSSGTSGQQVSRIYLDKDTSARQSKALTRIVSSFIGKKRLPLLIIDSSAVFKDRAMFSARGAGIRGFSLLGRDTCYALDADMKVDMAAVLAFAKKYRGQPTLLFGFTFMIWQHFYLALRQADVKLDLQGFLIHGGGWKKLTNIAVSNSDFKQALSAQTGITHVFDYYGMVEQTGSIFMECEQGHLHASVFSDVDILDPLTLEPGATGRGCICTTSLLPTSYPGHILLTEDEGEILGQDTCPCGRLGKYFKVYGRMPGAEIRGCSDTYVAG